MFIPVFEVSAKTGDSVPELFAALSSLVSERFPERMDVLWEQGGNSIALYWPEKRPQNWPKTGPK